MLKRKLKLPSKMDLSYGRFEIASDFPSNFDMPEKISNKNYGLNTIEKHNNENGNGLDTPVEDEW